MPDHCRGDHRRLPWCFGCVFLRRGDRRERITRRSDLPRHEFGSECCRSALRNVGRQNHPRGVLSAVRCRSASRAGVGSGCGRLPLARLGDKPRGPATLTNSSPRTRTMEEAGAVHRSSDRIRTQPLRTAKLATRSKQIVSFRFSHFQRKYFLGILHALICGKDGLHLTPFARFETSESVESDSCQEINGADRSHPRLLLQPGHPLWQHFTRTAGQNEQGFIDR